MKDHKLVIKKFFKGATAEALYDAWTKPEVIAKWYGPEGFTNDIHEMEVREGGKYRLTMNAPDGGKHVLAGVYQTLKRPAQIVLTWRWQTENIPDMVGGQETLVTVDIAPKDGGVEMTMTHSRFTSSEQVENHNKGWSSSLNKLEKLVSA